MRYATASLVQTNVAGLRIGISNSRAFSVTSQCICSKSRFLASLSCVISPTVTDMMSVTRVMHMMCMGRHLMLLQLVCNLATSAAYFLKA